MSRKGEKSVSRRARKNISVTHKPSKPAPAKCGLCAAKLHGVPRKSVAQLKKLSKVEKRPERKFGGVLCHNCVAAIIKESARLASGSLTRRDVDLRHLQYMKG